MHTTHGLSDGCMSAYREAASFVSDVPVVQPPCWQARCGTPGILSEGCAVDIVPDTRIYGVVT